MTESDLAQLVAEQDILRSIHLLAHHLFHFERKIMTDLTNITDKVTGLETAVAAGNTKIDALVEVANESKALLDQMAQGNGPDQQAIEALAARIGAVVDSVTGESTKVDAAVSADAPPAPPPPAPAPAPAAQGDTGTEPGSIS